jgi:hypothetical protein
LTNSSGNVKVIEAGMDQCLGSLILLCRSQGLAFSDGFVGMFVNTYDLKPSRNVFLFNLQKDEGISGTPRHTKWHTSLESK